MAETASVKYVYLDIVGFTHGRSVEAQSDIVSKLNAIVRAGLDSVRSDVEKQILIPTGDGIAIALLEEPSYDIHLRLALELLRLVDEANSNADHEMRRFAIRVGINENVDNVISDINGRRNVAGAGISMAQRIMDQADAGQVLVGESVHQILRQREAYMSAFRSYRAVGKHKLTFPVYQFVGDGGTGLNRDVPAAFASTKTQPRKFTKMAAYFIGHAVSNRTFLVSQTVPGRWFTSSVLLASLARDSIEVSERAPYDEPWLQTWGAGKVSFEDQYEYYHAVDFHVRARLATLFEERYLEEYDSFFEQSDGIEIYPLPKESAVKKLIAEWPHIAAEFGLNS